MLIKSLHNIHVDVMRLIKSYHHIGNSLYKYKLKFHNLLSTALVINQIQFIAC